MRTTAIILDRLDASLQKQGVKLKRNELLETAAMAFGYHNQNEFTAAAKENSLQATSVNAIGRMEMDETSLIVLKQEDGAIYAVEESFLSQVVGEERREAFGPSPYGGLNDLRNIDGKLSNMMTGFLVFDCDGDLIDTCETFEEARDLFGDERGTKASIIDLENWTIMRWEFRWRPENLRDIGQKNMANLYIAKTIADLTYENEKLELRCQNLIVNAPDWAKWEKDLKKASRKGKEPISDEDLYRFRHAIADNHVKNSSSERFKVKYRQERFMDMHLGGLIARLDRAEEALREANLAPKEIERKSIADAEEQLAAIEFIINSAQMKETPFYELKAVKDGDICEEIFKAEEGEEPSYTARKIAAAYYQMNLESYKDSEDYSDFDYDLDYFECSNVKISKALKIVQDAYRDLNPLYEHKDIATKLLAAINEMMPKATI